MAKLLRLAAASLIALALTVSPAAGSTAKAGTAPTAAKAAPPFARVYLAVRGCVSCAHCRTNVRQMIRANSQGGEARFGDDQVEVLYPKPQTVPLRDVIRSLAENRLHDLSLVDVLFDARGVIRTSEKGLTTFALAETGQTFPLVLVPAAARPADGTPVRLTAVVDGWREKGALSLQSKEIVAAN